MLWKSLGVQVGDKCPIGREHLSKFYNSIPVSPNLHPFFLQKPKIIHLLMLMKRNCSDLRHGIVTVKSLLVPLK